MRAALGIIAAAFVFATGCAKSDWIDRTLVTVDVTGVWQGTMTVGGGSYVVMSCELTLQQVGPKVTGRLSHVNPAYAGPIEGTVNGDTFRFRTSRGGTGELQVNGDEMTGTGSGATSGGQAIFSLHRQPQ